MEKNKQKLVEKASLAKESERYSEVATLMMDIVETGTELDDVERNLLAEGFTKIINDRRRSIDNLAIRRLISSSKRQQALLNNYVLQIEKEIDVLCCTLLRMLIKCLLPKACDAESKVLYLKLKGDIYRHLSEISICIDKEATISNAKVAYEIAFKLSREEIEPKHPVRLATALSYSVFVHDSLLLKDEGRFLAQQAITDIWTDTTNEKILDNEIVTVIKHHLHLWKADIYKTDEMPKLPIKDIQVEKALVALKAELYDDMALEMRDLIENNFQLNVEERHLFVLSYKKLLDQRKSSLNKILGFENSTVDSKKSKKIKYRRKLIVRQYTQKIKKEYEIICVTVLNLLDKYLIPNTVDSHFKVFYLTLQAEYYENLVDMKIYNTSNANNALLAYEHAFIVAEATLLPSDDLRLRLVMNYTTFLHNVLCDKENACSIAKQALFDAGSLINFTRQFEDTYILNKIKSNLKLWMSTCSSKKERRPLQKK